MSDFLTALAGLTGGLSQGLETRREQKNLESERAFRLQEFEAQSRRAAQLDALNEEMTRAQLSLAQRAQKLDEERSNRDKTNAELVDFPVGGQTFKVSRAGADRLTEQLAAFEMQKSMMVPLGTGGFGSPEFVANLARLKEESGEKRKETIAGMIADREASLLETLGPSGARENALEFGRMLELLTGEATIPNIQAEQRKQERLMILRSPELQKALGIKTREEEGIGLGDRLGGLLTGTRNPVESLRSQMFGPRPPQTIAELQAAREGRLLTLRALQARQAMQQMDTQEQFPQFGGAARPPF